MNRFNQIVAAAVLFIFSTGAAYASSFSVAPEPVYKLIKTRTVKSASYTPSKPERKSSETRSAKPSHAPEGMVLIRRGSYYAGLNPRAAINALGKLGYHADQEEFIYNAAPAHETLIDDFYIDKYEVTQADFERVMWTNPSSSQNPDQPVERVTWYEAKEYCERVGKRLPTEAEWEKAARGKLNAIYSWGNEFEDKKANFCNINCNEKWSDTRFNDQYGRLAPVGSYPPNGYGLYDMAGNVWEWVADWYDKDYYQKAPRSNPKGPDHGTLKVLRGGAWSSTPGTLRAAYRNRNNPSTRYINNGFRCAL
ncbi:MAG: formylglycine-generating enzyme family protein [Nitrospinales bacterium]